MKYTVPFVKHYLNSVCLISIYPNLVGANLYFNAESQNQQELEFNLFDS